MNAVIAIKNPWTDDEMIPWLFLIIKVGHFVAALLFAFRSSGLTFVADLGRFSQIVHDCSTIAFFFSFSNPSKAS